MWYVYILKCSDNTYYTGFTSNLENRMMAHEKGEVHYTSSRLPVTRVTYITFSEKNKAFLSSDT